MDRKSVLEVGKVLYHSGLPFRVRLFNILASLGFIISLCNGVLSYWNNGDRTETTVNKYRDCLAIFVAPFLRIPQ